MRSGLAPPVPSPGIRPGSSESFAPPGAAACVTGATTTGDESPTDALRSDELRRFEMIQMCDLNDRPAKAGDLTSELLAAYETFDIILLAIRGRQDPGTCMFTALVRSASCAVDGRDALRRAPSLPLSAISPPIITRRAGAREPGIRDLAQDLSAL